jgi:diketogulonate reductase-like aldo/keto reductase
MAPKVMCHIGGLKRGSAGFVQGLVIKIQEQIKTNLHVVSLLQLQLTIQSRTKLNNGVEIPVLGLGVYQSPPGQATQNAVKWALEYGYRHVDTARIYGNEKDVGLGLRESRVPREDVFITTKLWNSDHGYEPALRACEESLRRLGLSYVDLYLIHWPEPGARGETWKAMVKLHNDGKCRAIGVSNYTIRHLKELLDGSDVVPAVNQVEFHPFLYQKELLDFCRANKVQLEAYSPLTRAERLHHPKVLATAARHKRSPAQVLIRWSLQHGLVAIPKSTRRERILENSLVFDFSLSKEEMETLNSLNEGYRTSWDPTGMP